MAEKEYGAPRARAGWVFMSYPDLPDNDPIEVLEAAVEAKESRGWLVVEFTDEVDTNGSSWETVEDPDAELTEDGD
jgi:hypothetical protein